MQNQKSSTALQEYQQKLNEIILSPSLENLNQFFDNEATDFEQALLCSKETFLSRVERNAVVAKKTILQQFLISFPLLQDNEIDIFKHKILCLALPLQHILKDGIIALYSDLTENRTSAETLDRSSEMEVLLEKTRQSLQTLMRDHFIWKEIKKIQSQATDTNSMKMILSEKKIVESLTSLEIITSQHSMKQLISSKAICEIQRNIECRSIQELLTEQLKGQQDEVSEAFERCRICKNTFKLKHLQSHVRYCSRLEANKSKRNELIQKQTRIIEEMKKQIMRDNVIFESNEDLFSFEVNKVYKNVINMFDKLQKSKVQRRITVGFKQTSDKNILDQIDQFLLQNHSNELLEQFKQFHRQRIQIQKKISALQNSYQWNRKQKENSDISIQIEFNPSSYNLSNKTSKGIAKTKKSIFARKSESAQGNSKRQIDKVMKFQSIKDSFDQFPQEEEHEEKTKMHRSMTNFHKEHEQKFGEISVDDFELIKFLGKGAFGKVYMAKRKNTGDIYALKVIQINENWGNKQLESIKNEHQILSQIAGDHLVKAPFSFTQGLAHFFVLEYMPGGDLAKVLQQEVYLEQEQAKHYLAEIVLAIEHLHSFGIIHRDLKPQNLIFDQKGHLKLTDFGLSEMRINDKIQKARKMYHSGEEAFKRSNQQFPVCEKKSRLKSALIEVKNKVRLIGTPDYIAPEIISGESLDNLSIDWWSFGVIAYEMMVGCRPFCADSIDEIIENITNLNIEWPQIGEEQDMIDPLAADFIKKLLNQNFSQRLGAHGVSEIKKHPFFSGICWQTIKLKRPPLILQIDRKQKYEMSQEDPDLRTEIKTAIGNHKLKSNFKLENFVRYDILVEQTLQSADKQMTKRSARIKKLKSLVSSMQNPNLGSEKGNLSRSQELLEKNSIEGSWKLLEHVV